jgi:hypothetical protein
MAKGVKTGGRKAGVPNKATAAIKALAEPYSGDAIQTLAGIMLDAKAPHAARIAAARELIDRGHGKAKEIVAIEGNIPPFVLQIEDVPPK